VSFRGSKYKTKDSFSSAKLCDDCKEEQNHVREVKTKNQIPKKLFNLPGDASKS